MHPAERFPHLLQKFFNTPLALRPDKAEIIMGVLAKRANMNALQIDGRSLALDDDGGALDTAARKEIKGYSIVAGIAVIPVQGTLVQKLGTLRPWSGMTGYDGIRVNLLQALADDEVEGIVLDVDSPGGECAGCFDLADTIFAARKRKPIWSILSEGAFSAGYALACSAQKVIVPRTGGTGSIGIICMHSDISSGLEKAGIKVTVIQYGARKADFADFAPLGKEARERAQHDVDVMGAMFDDLVARNRGIAASKIKGFQATTFLGAEGVAAGLADECMAPDQAMRTFLKTL